MNPNSSIGIIWFSCEVFAGAPDYGADSYSRSECDVEAIITTPCEVFAGAPDYGADSYSRSECDVEAIITTPCEVFAGAPDYGADSYSRSECDVEAIITTPCEVFAGALDYGADLTFAPDNGRNSTASAVLSDSLDAAFRVRARRVPWHCSTAVWNRDRNRICVCRNAHYWYATPGLHSS